MTTGWDPSKPFNELPPLPPGREVETRSVLKLTIEARAALAALNQGAQSMPNPSVLLNTLPLLEAQASSEVENIVTTADELFIHAQAESGSATPATKEALRYRTALFEGIRLVRDRGIITTNTARDVCTTIKQHRMDLRSGTGTYIGNPVTKVPVYTPPEGREIIDRKLSEWETFVNGAHDLDPLVRMALAHYQFEAIHPFDDGNGRTGRILNILVLVAAGLLHHPVLYLSKFIIDHKGGYYDALRAVSASEAWPEWTEYMLEAVRATSVSTLTKINRTQQLQEQFKAEISKVSSGGHIALMDVLFEQPYCRITNVMQRCGVSRPTATKWLKSLESTGALASKQIGRELIFINYRFMNILVHDGPPEGP